MLVSNGSALIHCRTRYCDFPGKLFQFPNDFTREQIYGARALVLQTTEAMEELRQSHGRRRVVIGTGTHLVLGITAYINDVLCSPLWSGKEANRGQISGDMPYADRGGRPVYGFFGFVWRRQDGYPAQLSKGFPTSESFEKMVKTQVIPKWELRYWEESRGAAYEETVELEPFLPDIVSENHCAGLLPGEKMQKIGPEANEDPIALKVYPHRLEQAMLHQTLVKAVRCDRPVSCCTGFPSLNSAGRSAFMNATCMGPDDGRILLKRRKVKTGQNVSGRKQEESRKSRV